MALHNMVSIEENNSLWDLSVTVMDEQEKVTEGIEAVRFFCQQGYYISFCSTPDHGTDFTIYLKEKKKETVKGYITKSLIKPSAIKEGKKLKLARKPGQVERFIAAQLIKRDMTLPKWLEEYKGMDAKKVLNEEFGLYTIDEWIEATGYKTKAQRREIS